VVVEIESPDDETWEKLGFYADHGVEELLIVSLQSHSVTWLALADGQYEQVEESGLLGPDSRTLGARIEWPEDD
jgi:hypothetical protein